LIPFIYLFISWGVGRFLSDIRNSYLRILSVAVVLFLVFCGFLETISYTKPSKFLLGKIYKGYNYWELIPAYLSAARPEDNLLNIVKKLDDEDAAAYYSLIGWRLYETFSERRSKIDKALDNRNELLKYMLYTGIGEALRERFDNDLNEVEKKINKLPKFFKTACYDGYFYKEAMEIPYVSLENGKKVDWDLKEILDEVKLIPPDFQNAAYRGIARAITAREIFYTTSKLLPLQTVIPKCLSVLPQIPEEQKSAFIEGCTFKFVSYWLEGINKYVFMDNFYEKMQRSEMRKIIDGSLRKISLVFKNTDERCYPFIIEGIANAIKENVSNDDFKTYLIKSFPKNEQKLLENCLKS
ncbi:MAG: hypothetical protein D6734_07060, partial [Candidatus Schekmanbacteria bacterium]